MKQLRIAIVLALSVLTVLFAAHAAAAAPANEVARPADETREAWMTKIRQAAEIGSVDELGRLVRTNQKHAIDSVIYTCEGIASGNNEQFEKDRAALEKGWKASMKTDFVDKIYTYFSFLDPEIRRQRAAMKVRYDKLATRYAQAQKANEQHSFPGIGLEFRSIGMGFVELGDHYFASQSYLYYAICYDESLRGEQAEFDKAWDGYKLTIEHRDKVELRDVPYSETKQRWEVLDKLGYGDSPAAGGGTSGPSATEAAVGTAITVPMAFQPLQAVDEIERPTYWADEVYPAWRQVSLRGVGSTARFEAFEKGPTVIRVGASKPVVDVDNDGEGDVEIELTGKITPVTVEIGEGAEKRPWSFFTVTGSQQDTYQGITMGLQPDDNYMNLYVAAAGAMAGMIGETPVRVIDDNMDGVYGSLPKGWQYIGCSENNFHQTMDSIVVGAEKRARPWSEYIQVEDQWHKVAATNGGNQIEAAPAEVMTGTLKLKTKGIKPSWVVVKGAGKFENCYFDLLQNGSKGVAVPSGRYSLFCGFLSEGKRMSVMKALILPGKTTTTWNVQPGEDVTIELGAPFGFDFQHVVGDDSVKIVGPSVVVTGVAAERYERLWNCAVKPEVSVRKAGAKRGGKYEDINVATGQDDIDKHGWGAVWMPLDTEIPAEVGEEGIQVQLYQKKHKLFGEIESAWKD